VQLTTLVTGKRTTIITVANRLVEEGRLTRRAGKRGAFIYDIPRTVSDDEPEQQTAPGEREQLVLQSTRAEAARASVAGSRSSWGQPGAFPVAQCCRCLKACATAGGLWCDECALVSRREAGLGG
jgi:hypothetical protein